MNKLLKILLYILYSDKCSGCKSKKETPLCKKCIEYLSNQSLKTVSIKEMSIFYIYHYKDQRIKNILWDLKYRNNILLRKVLGSIVYTKIKHLFDSEIIYGIPIPKNKIDSKKREFDHACLFAECLSKHISNLKIINLLEKKGTMRQVEQKTRMMRLEKVRNTMSVKIQYSISGKNILILDDVITTGGTLKEATRVISSQKPKHIFYFVLAH